MPPPPPLLLLLLLQRLLPHPSRLRRCCCNACNRGSIVSQVLGVSYTQGIRLHRWLGQWVALTISLHGLMYWLSWAADGRCVPPPHTHTACSPRAFICGTLRMR
jgi:hypothetical protein